MIEKKLYLDSSAYWRMKNIIEVLSQGKGSLAERLDIARLTFVFTPQDFSTDEQKRLCVEISDAYMKHTPLWQNDKPLKRAHWIVRRKLAQNLTLLFFSIIEPHIIKY